MPKRLIWLTPTVRTVSISIAHGSAARHTLSHATRMKQMRQLLANGNDFTTCVSAEERTTLKILKRKRMQGALADAQIESSGSTEQAYRLQLPLPLQIAKPKNEKSDM
eukprot:s4752_g3.t1